MDPGAAGAGDRPALTAAYRDLLQRACEPEWRQHVAATVNGGRAGDVVFVRSDEINRLRCRVEALVRDRAAAEAPSRAPRALLIFEEWTGKSVGPGMPAKVGTVTYSGLTFGQADVCSRAEPWLTTRRAAVRRKEGARTLELCIIQARLMLAVRPPHPLSAGMAVCEAFQRTSKRAVETFLITADRQALRKGTLVEVVDLHPSLAGTHRVARTFRKGKKLGIVLLDVQPVAGWECEQDTAKVPKPPPNAQVWVLRSADENLCLYHILILPPGISAKQPDDVPKAEFLDHLRALGLGQDAVPPGTSGPCATDMGRGAEAACLNAAPALEGALIGEDTVASAAVTGQDSLGSGAAPTAAPAPTLSKKRSLPALVEDAGVMNGMNAAAPAGAPQIVARGNGCSPEGANMPSAKLSGSLQEKMALELLTDHIKDCEQKILNTLHWSLSFVKCLFGLDGFDSKRFMELVMADIRPLLHKAVFQDTDGYLQLKTVCLVKPIRMHLKACCPEGPFMGATLAVLCEELEYMKRFCRRSLKDELGKKGIAMTKRAIDGPGGPGPGQKRLRLTCTQDLSEFDVSLLGEYQFRAFLNEKLGLGNVAVEHLIAEFGIDAVRGAFVRATELVGMKEQCGSGKKAPRLGDVFIQQIVVPDLQRDEPRKADIPPMYRYQEECVGRAAERQNVIVVAPPSSGKTRIFIECARAALKNNPSAKVLVVVKQVGLAEQQAGEFVANGFSTTTGFGGATGRVGAFHGDNKLNSANWHQKLQDFSVLVVTAQMLVNLLDQNTARFDQISLLVLDECHYTKGNDPYLQIMEFWHATKGPLKPQDSAATQLEQLQKNMCARLILIDGNNAEQEAIVPHPKEEVFEVHQRECDYQFTVSIGRFIGDLLKHDTHRQLLFPDDEETQENLGKVTDVFEGRKDPMFDSILHTAVSFWKSKESGGPAFHTGRLAVLTFLHHCNVALDMVLEAGYEAALRHLCHIIVQLGGPDGVGLYMKEKACIRMEPEAGGHAFSRRTAPTVCCPGNDIETMSRTYFCHLMREFLSNTMMGDTRLVDYAFSTRSVEADHRCFPRFRTLISKLDEFKDHEELHAMVLVRHREVVYFLSDMIRQSGKLRNLQPVELIGHGSRKNELIVLTLPSSKSGAQRGMTGEEQKAALDKFKTPGRRLLVATSAGEEGINVPSCELVVRYNVSRTGTERIQSRGRTRVKQGLFVNILMDGTDDTRMYEKSRLEEDVAVEALKKADVERIL